MLRVARIVGIVLLLALIGADVGAYAQLQSTLLFEDQVARPAVTGAQFEVWRNGQVLTQSHPFSDAPVRVIVQFTTPPLLAKQTKGMGASKLAHIQSVQSQHIQFEEDLRQFYTDVSSAGKAANTGEMRHFENVYNGVATTVPGWMIHQIRRLDYVKQVHIDGEVFATTAAPSNSSVRPTAGATLGGTGAGIRIAIIDTGIDYTHLSLGGGFGPSYKVVDGFDFVNDDADPLDDNGHGTHVAGIVAGFNEHWQGVAPEAELLAYKVLDQDGAGRDAWVLSAIERALDPDNDPATDDAVDIINLSLGSGVGSNSDHPVTVAVEHVIEAGIVCVVAAGNAGQLGKATIAAPGNALKAITVGAITDNGEIAAFSAQGPTGSVKTTSMPRFGIKPDLFAPGVDVYSTWLNGAFKQMDGTSMATPHITGMAARILELNTDWTPAQVKSALVLFADNDGFLPWQQEDGRVSALPAKELPAMVTPARFDFGLIDVSAAFWSRSDTLTLYNFDTTEKTYVLSASGDYPGDIQFLFSSVSVTVTPGEVYKIPFSITGPCASLPSKAFPDAFTGKILLQGTTDNLTVPFSFFNPGLARLTLKEPADVLFLFGQEEGHEFTFFDSSGEMYLFLPEDRYDAIAQFGGGSHVVIKEDIFDGGVVQNELSSGEAIHVLQLDPRDNRQQPLTHVSGMHAITHKATGYAIVRQGGFLSMAAALPATQYFSSFSDAYKVEIKATGFSDAGGYYELPFSVTDGMSDDVVLSNGADSLVQINYHYAIPDGYEKLFFVPWSYTSITQDRRSTIGAKLDLEEETPFVLRAPFELSIFLLPPPTPDFSWQGHFHTLHTDDFSLFKLATGVNQVTLLETDEVHAGTEGLLRVGSGNTLTYPSDQPLDLYPGAGLLRWAGSLDNSSTKIKIHEAPEGGFFINEWGDLSPHASSVKLYADDQLVLNDSLFNVPNLPVARWLGESQMTVAPGAYKLVIEDGFSSAYKWKARSEATLEFQTNLADANPPRITQLFVASEGMPRRVLHPERAHNIVLGVSEVCSWCADDALPAALRVEIRAAQDSLWRNLDVERMQEWYSIPLPEGLKEGYYAIRVSAEDASMNKLTYVLEPAFELGVSHVPLLQEPVMGQAGVLQTQVFSWQPTREAMAYQVQVATDSTFESLIFEANYTEDKTPLPFPADEGLRYYWRVRAKTPEGYMPWSEPFWFETEDFIDAGPATPDAFNFYQIYPNPVEQSASMLFSIPEAALVKIELFDTLGRRISLVEEGMRPAGKYVHLIDATTLASGAYIVRLQAAHFVATRKFIKV